MRDLTGHNHPSTGSVAVCCFRSGDEVGTFLQAGKESESRTGACSRMRTRDYRLLPGGFESSCCAVAFATYNPQIITAGPRMVRCIVELEWAPRYGAT